MRRAIQRLAQCGFEFVARDGLSQNRHIAKTVFQNVLAISGHEYEWDLLLAQYMGKRKDEIAPEIYVEHGAVEPTVVGGGDRAGEIPKRTHRLISQLNQMIACQHSDDRLVLHYENLFLAGMSVEVAVLGIDFAIGCGLGKLPWPAQQLDRAA